jgi:amino-acid N-acetyltransferase
LTAASVTISAATTSEIDAVLTLLAQRHLPEAGLRDHASTLIVARHDARIVGSVALERYATGALLRSLAVDSEFEGQGVGSRLTQAVLDQASASGVTTVYLLTTTAETFFPRFGFAPVQRTEVPSEIRASVEFTTACPSTAVVMKKQFPAGSRF